MLSTQLQPCWSGPVSSLQRSLPSARIPTLLRLVSSADAQRALRLGLVPGPRLQLNLRVSKRIHHGGENDIYLSAGRGSVVVRCARGELKVIDSELDEASALLVDADKQLQLLLAVLDKAGDSSTGKSEPLPSQLQADLAQERVKRLAAYERQLIVERQEVAARAAGEAIAMAAGLRPAPAAVQDFWRCLEGAVIDADGFLRLAVGTTFPGCTHDVLMVRESYIDLYAKMLQGLAWPRRRFLITGGPGIGKTFFSYYLMFLLASDGRTVLYESHRDPGKVLLFRSTGIVLRGIRDDFEDEFADSKCWYIVDGLKPAGYASARTVAVATTPMHKFKYKHFLKCSCDLDLPTWSRDEIDTCWHTLRQYVPNDLYSI